MEPIRIQKYFTDCGVLSRRAAEEAIEAGEVTVDGVRASVGQKILPNVNLVCYKGQPVTMQTHAENLYVMLNKPRGYLTTMRDDRGRSTVTDLVEGIPQRVYPVGRLDMDSEGLLLLTNDGSFTNYLTHPRHEIPKIYHVKIKGAVTQDQIKALGKPMSIDGYTIRPVDVKLASLHSDSSILSMRLFEGRNRQIRKMCETVGLEILSLRRVAIGQVELGRLEPGKWRYLSKAEVNYLKTGGHEPFGGRNSVSRQKGRR